MKPTPPFGPTNRFQSAPSYRPQPQGMQVHGGQARLPRVAPTLTVYADGYIQPNAEGAALLSERADGLCFHAPEPVRAGRQPKPWQVSPGNCHLFVRHSAKPGQLRLRAAGDCPPEGLYLLLPIAGQPDRFTLLPT